MPEDFKDLLMDSLEEELDEYAKDSSDIYSLAGVALAFAELQVVYEDDDPYCEGLLNKVKALLDKSDLKDVVQRNLDVMLLWGKLDNAQKAFSHPCGKRCEGCMTDTFFIIDDIVYDLERINLLVSELAVRGVLIEEKTLAEIAGYEAELDILLESILGI